MAAGKVSGLGSKLQEAFSQAKIEYNGTRKVEKEVLEKAKELPGTLDALIYDDKWNLVARVPVKDLYDTLAKMEPGKAYAVIYDGIITQRMLDIAAEKGIKLLIATKIGSIERRPQGVQMLTFDDILTP